jgi:hypothetical protein
VPFLKEVQTFPDGPVLFEHCSKFGFEGVVSKRLASRYASGPSHAWVKSKCPQWKRDNVNRHKIFEKPPRPPAPTERDRALRKKREELARVQERLAARGLRAGMRAAMEAQVKALVQEIAELEG